MPDLQSDSAITEEKAREDANRLWQAWKTGFLFERLTLFALFTVFLAYCMFYNRSNWAAFIAGLLVTIVYWCLCDYLRSRDFILNKMPLIMQGKVSEVLGGEVGDTKRKR